jgi:hypothetical protein
MPWDSPPRQAFSFNSTVKRRSSILATAVKGDYNGKCQLKFDFNLRNSLGVP